MEETQRKRKLELQVAEQKIRAVLDQAEFGKKRPSLNGTMEKVTDVGGELRTGKVCTGGCTDAGKKEKGVYWGGSSRRSEGGRRGSTFCRKKGRRGSSRVGGVDLPSTGRGHGPLMGRRQSKKRGHAYGGRNDQRALASTLERKRCGKQLFRGSHLEKIGGKQAPRPEQRLGGKREQRKAH